MIPFSPGLALYLLFICMVVATGTGALVGAIASLALRLPVRGIWKDALLGLFGFLMAFGAFVFLGPLRAFVNSDEGPLRASLVAAAALPVLRQLFNSFSLGEVQLSSGHPSLNLAPNGNDRCKRRFRPQIR